MTSSGLSKTDSRGDSGATLSRPYWCPCQSPQIHVQVEGYVSQRTYGSLIWPKSILYCYVSSRNVFIRTSERTRRIASAAMYLPRTRSPYPTKLMHGLDLVRNFLLYGAGKGGLTISRDQKERRVQRGFPQGITFQPQNRLDAR